MIELPVMYLMRGFLPFMNKPIWSTRFKKMKKQGKRKSSELCNIQIWVASAVGTDAVTFSYFILSFSLPNSCVGSQNFPKRLRL